MRKIDLYDGKYTVIFDDGKLSALRYGEPWRDITGDNLIYWMFVEIEELRQFIAESGRSASGEPIYQIMATDDDDNPAVRNLWMDVSHEYYQSIVGDVGIRSRIVYKNKQ